MAPIHPGEILKEGWNDLEMHYEAMQDQFVRFFAELQKGVSDHLKEE